MGEPKTETSLSSLDSPSFLDLDSDVIIPMDGNEGSFGYTNDWF
jgi:hypothetical protein